MASSPALLKRRVQSILDEQPNTSGWSRGLRLAGNAALVAWTLVVMPRVNVFFAEDAGALALHTSPRLIAGPAEPHSIAHLSRTAPHHRLRSAPQPSPGAVATTATATVAHDQLLAAEHRIGVDVVTESTEMEPAPGAELRAGSGTTPDSDSSAHIQDASWVKVAVDAAERIGPLLVDRDADGRHMH
jgi:hypothetical protein